MAAKSSIAWVNAGVEIDGVYYEVAGATLNFLYGCQKVSTLCTNCYAMWDVSRLAGNPNPAVSAGKAGLVKVKHGRPQWTGKLQIAEERLDLPLRWEKPRLIFTNSLSDVFYGGHRADKGEVPFPLFCRFMDVMCRAPQHIYQVLTKRFGRAVDFLMDYAKQEWGDTEWEDARGHFEEYFPHVWWGFSAGTQAEFDEACAFHRDLPGAVRWLSMEPLPGPVDVFHGASECYAWAGKSYRNSRLLDWIVTGGESRDGARFLDLAWIEDILLKCDPLRLWRPGPEVDDSVTPVFVKQLGEPWARENRAQNRKGEDPAEWPAHLRVRQWPEPHMTHWLETRVKPYLLRHPGARGEGTAMPLPMLEAPTLNFDTGGPLPVLAEPPLIDRGRRFG